MKNNVREEHLVVFKEFCSRYIKYKRTQFDFGGFPKPPDWDENYASYCFEEFYGILDKFADDLRALRCPLESKKMPALANTGDCAFASAIREAETAAINELLRRIIDVVYPQNGQ